jgi:hypothetical protein
MVSKLEEGKKAGYIVQGQNRMTTIFKKRADSVPEAPTQVGSGENGGKLVFFLFFLRS